MSSALNPIERLSIGSKKGIENMIDLSSIKQIQILTTNKLETVIFISKDKWRQFIGSQCTNTWVIHTITFSSDEYVQAISGSQNCNKLASLFFHTNKCPEGKGGGQMGENIFWTECEEKECFPGKIAKIKLCWDNEGINYIEELC